MMIYRFAEGRIVEQWRIADDFSRLRQIGAFPGPVRAVTEPTDEPRGAFESVAENKATIHRYFDARNRRDPATIDTLIAPDFVRRSPPVIRGIAAYKDWSSHLEAAWDEGAVEHPGHVCRGR